MTKKASRFDSLVVEAKSVASRHWFDRLPAEGKKELEEFRADWDSGRWDAIGMYAVSVAGSKLAATFGVKIGRAAVSRWLRRVPA